MNKIIKLSSGEEIVCKLVEREHNRSYEIENPLKIHTVPKVTNDGIEEAISLQKWIHFAEEQVFLLEKNKVMVIAEASYGLSKFYEYCVDRMNADYSDIGDEPSDKELREIENEELEEMFEGYSVNSKLLH